MSMIWLYIIYGILYACLIGAIIFNIWTANRNIRQMRKNLVEYMNMLEDYNKIKVTWYDGSVTFIDKDGK